MSCYYPAHCAFDPQSDTWQISFKDFPEQQAACYKREDVELEAQENLLLAIAIDMEEGRLVPLASPLQNDEIAIHLPLLITLKVALHNLLLQTGSSKIVLARQMALNSAQIDRLLDVSYASKVEVLEQALFLLGYEIQATVVAIQQ